MKKITDSALLQHYISSSGYSSFFSFPVDEHISLYRSSRGEDILQEGASAENMLYYLVSGRVKLFGTLSNGKISLLDFMEDSGFLGELELLHVRSSTIGIRALSTCYFLALPLRVYRSQLLTDPTFLRTLCEELARKEQKRMYRLMQMQGFPLKNRFAQLILIASVNGVYTERNTDASAYLGTSYRHLTQMLAEFVDKGYVSKISGGYRIANEAALQQLASEMEFDI